MKGDNGQQVVHFEEFRGSIKFADFLQLIDGYPITVEVKGSHKHFWPDVVLISSVHELKDLYSCFIYPY
jgi:hypothetical protein